jgi:coiled-coil domain-containing protein 130
MIGRGVRFNAEKSKAGKYYTTTLWSFKMKCHMCDGTIVVETDPKNDDYKMVEGVKPKNETYTAASTETIELADGATKERLASDPMYRLEHGEADKKVAKTKRGSLAALLQHKSGADDFGANQALRGAFRVKRKQLKAQVSTPPTPIPSSSSSSLPTDLCTSWIVCVAGVRVLLWQNMHLRPITCTPP